MKPFFSHPASLAAIALTVMSTTTKAATLYSQSFATNNTSLSTYSWQGWGALGDSDTAVNYTSTSTAAPNARLRVLQGNGQNVAIFAQARQNATSGVPNPTVNDRFVAVTTNIGGPYNLVSSNLGVIEWRQSVSAHATQFVRVMVQVDGNWYASSTSYTNSASGSSGASTSERETKQLDLAGPLGLNTTSWRTATFGDGAAITLGATEVTTPIGSELTGIGFFIFTGDASNRTVWIDDVLLTSVPEPSGALLMAGGLAVLLGGRRRRN